MLLLLLILISLFHIYSISYINLSINEMSGTNIIMKQDWFQMCLAFDRFMKRNFFISLNWQMNTLQIDNIKGLFSIDRDILVIPTEFCLTEHNILSLNKNKTEIIQIKWHEEMLAPWLINGFKPLQKKKHVVYLISLATWNFGHGRSVAV